jgi:hypothetical protein
LKGSVRHLRKKAAFLCNDGSCGNGSLPRGYGDGRREQIKTLTACNPAQTFSRPALRIWGANPARFSCSFFWFELFASLKIAGYSCFALEISGFECQFGGKIGAEREQGKAVQMIGDTCGELNRLTILPVQTGSLNSVGTI